MKKIIIILTSILIGLIIVACDPPGFPTNKYQQELSLLSLSDIATGACTIGEFQCLTEYTMIICPAGQKQYYSCWVLGKTCLIDPDPTKTKCVP